MGGGSVVVGGGSVGPPVVVSSFFLSFFGFSGFGGAPAFAYSPLNGTQTAGFLGNGQVRSDAPSKAWLMKRFQIVAGKLPPATVIPWTLVISICAFG